MATRAERGLDDPRTPAVGVAEIAQRALENWHASYKPPKRSREHQVIC
jgi:hypothetical protein